MSDQHACPIAKQFGQSLDKKYGTVLTAGATDGDRQVAAVIALKSGQPFFDESADIFHQLDAILLCV
jgi:hypothetical protein